MRPVQTNLIADETVIYRTGLHWIVFFMPVLILLFFGLPGILFLIAGISGLITKQPETGLLEAGLFGLLWTGIVLARAILRKKAAQFVVTNKRVIFTTGMIQLHTFVVPLHQIESVSVYQNGFVFLLFRYGTVTVKATGGTVEHFVRVSRAPELRQHILEQMASMAKNSKTAANC